MIEVSKQAFDIMVTVIKDPVTVVCHRGDRINYSEGKTGTAQLIAQEDCGKYYIVKHIKL